MPQNKVLFSIKPKFAERIFDGSKKYEYRRKIFKRPDIDTVILYASLPIQLVVGEFKIETILEDVPEKLWEKTQDFSGINKEFFSEYFSRRNVGFAIKVKEAYRYQKPFCLQELYNINPPQSFCYV